MDLSNIDVLILAAGFGKRLGPRTSHTPKPLIVVAGKTLLERNLEQLQTAGFRRVCINLHYRGDQIRDFVGDGARWNLKVSYSEEETILDTGGAIKNIEHWIRSDYFFTVNSDVVVEEGFPFADVFRSHTCRVPVPLATLVLRQDSDAARYGESALDSSGRIVSFLSEAIPTNENRRVGFMYTGIQCLSRRILQFMPPTGSVFSITKDTFAGILREGLGELSGYVYRGFWTDAGTLAGLDEAEKFFLRKG